jgi:hypothetical protein
MTTGRRERMELTLKVAIFITFVIGKILLAQNSVGFEEKMP